MHCIVRQDLAIDTVVGGRGDGSDHVGRVLNNIRERRLVSEKADIEG